jgi:hypothetical protein
MVGLNRDETVGKSSAADAEDAVSDYQRSLYRLFDLVDDALRRYQACERNSHNESVRFRICFDEPSSHYGDTGAVLVKSSGVGVLMFDDSNTGYLARALREHYGARYQVKSSPYRIDISELEA